MQIESDILYRTNFNDAQQCNTLDIYFTPPNGSGQQRPVIIYIHGGSWSSGDKNMIVQGRSDISPMPKWFVAIGCIFVSLNFRLAKDYRTKNATIPDMLEDIAKALMWLKVNIRRYGGKAKGFNLLGYSTGAHLASLIVADRRKYLDRFGMDSTFIRSLILVDGCHYDVPLVLQALREKDQGINRPRQKIQHLVNLTGKTPHGQKQLSPANFIQPELRATSFLLLSAGLHHGHEQTLTLRMNEQFKTLLQSCGIDVEHHHFPPKEHLNLIQEFDHDLQVTAHQFLATRSILP